MKMLLAAIVLWGVIAQAGAQQPLGLSAKDVPGSPIKLDGFVVHRVEGGYLAFSVPPKDIKRIWTMAEILSGHYTALAILDRLEKESLKLTPTPTSSAVPMGVCFLATDEVFQRHKILDRNVQTVGTYTYLNVNGLTRTVLAYSGGPRPR